MELIKSISKEQEALIPSYVDKWVGYASSPLDFAMADKVIEDVYKLMGFKKPTVLVATGPINAFWTAVAVQLVCGNKKAIEKIDSTLHSTLLSTLDSTLHSTLRSTLDSTLHSTLLSTLLSTLHSTLHSTLDSTLLSTLLSTLHSTLRSMFLSTKNNPQLQKAMKNAYDALYISHWWSFWAGYYDYAEMIGVKFDDAKKNLFLNFCREIPLIYAFDGLAIICHKPKIIWKERPHKKGEPINRILHNEQGPAIEYRDGFNIYCVNNVRVPEWVITTPLTEITKEQIASEKNSEVSRVIAERLGWDEYLKRVDTVLVHKWFDETTTSHYELYDFKDRKGSLQPRLLKMESPELNDRTRPYYIEPVPPQAKTCQSARRWQCDPARPEIKVCNKDPGLVFEVEA